MNRKILMISVGVPAALGAVFIGASPAQASPPPVRPPQIQFQSYQRASQNEVCAHQAWETPWHSDWNSADYDWTPSWAWWPNNHTGGWVCNRAITWDPGSPAYLGPG